MRAKVVDRDRRYLCVQQPRRELSVERNRSARRSREFPCSRPDDVGEIRSGFDAKVFCAESDIEYKETNGAAVRAGFETEEHTMTMKTSAQFETIRERNAAKADAWERSRVANHLRHAMIHYKLAHEALREGKDDHFKMHMEFSNDNLKQANLPSLDELGFGDGDWT